MMDLQEHDFESRDSQRRISFDDSSVATSTFSNASTVDAPPSPFLRPSTPQLVTHTTTITTPNGTHSYKQRKRVLKKKSGATDVPETKSTIFGACANLVNTIVGAGIIGMPYAVRECGLVTGVVMIMFVAFLCYTSLRIIIETGKHADVNSYELLMEAAFGKKGFVFISLNMFIINYGGMICFLSVIRDTIPALIGVEDDWGRGVVLIVSTLIIVFPLSMQRDMADLSKTSTVSVVMVLSMTMIVAYYSPIQESIEASGGLSEMIKESAIHPRTIFVGLGVLSFGFVCQDASFIIAGSLDRPTKDRWEKVARYSILICAIFAIFLGVFGYVGFQEKTQGNILNNFPTEYVTLDDNPSAIDSVIGSLEAWRAINLARALLGLTMFFVYPIASFIARHVIVVLLFKGRRAHEGDDHSVLARADRRIALTLFLYIIAIVPALLCDDLGSVLAITGAVGGSCLSYLGPGAAYLGIHGGDFLELVLQRECMFANMMWKYPTRSKRRRIYSISSFNNELGSLCPTEDTINERCDVDDMNKQCSICHCMSSFILLFAWYIFCMPLWCTIASTGNQCFRDFVENERAKSPAPKRLGKIIHERKGLSISKKKPQGEERFANLMHSFSDSNLKAQDVLLDPCPPKKHEMKLIPPSRPLSNQMKSSSKDTSPFLPSYGATGSSSIDRAIGASLHRMNSFSSMRSEEGEQDPQIDTPKWTHFLLAIAYIILGCVALIAGLCSIVAP